MGELIRLTERRSAVSGPPERPLVLPPDRVRDRVPDRPIDLAAARSRLHPTGPAVAQGQVGPAAQTDPAAPNQHEPNPHQPATHEPSTLRRLFARLRPSGGPLPCAPARSAAESGALRLALREVCGPGPEAPRLACGTFALQRQPRIIGRQNPGMLLSVETGSWAPAPERFRYQWYRDGRPIHRATGPRYRVEPEDRGTKLSVKVTAIRDGFAPRTATGTVN